MNFFSSLAFPAALELAQKGNIDELNKYLSKRPALVSMSKHGKTLLHVACQLKSGDMVMMLLMRGININILDGESRTAVSLRRV